MSAEPILAALGVSRETRARLETLAGLLAKWSPKINLVSNSSLAHVWTRHIADSAQIYGLAPKSARTWIDLGSGGGFPGLVIGALAAQFNPDLDLTLVESDQRKCAFLATASREMGIRISIKPQRIETLAPGPRDIISARALAALPKLLELAEPLSGPGTIALFPKGADARAELTSAARDWHIQHKAHPSATDPNAVILEILEFRRGPHERA